MYQIEGVNIELPGAQPPAAPETEEHAHFKDKDKKLTKLVAGHYLKGNLFFFIGCLCAILAGTKGYCIVLIFLVLGVKTAELAGLFLGYLWLSYASHAMVAIINYVNILTAICYYV